VINKVLKDVILRFRSMQGYQTPYVPGWDCHGPADRAQDPAGTRPEAAADGSRRRPQEVHEYAAKYVEVQSEQFQRLWHPRRVEQPVPDDEARVRGDTLEVFAKFVEAGLVYKKLKPVVVGDEPHRAGGGGAGVPGRRGHQRLRRVPVGLERLANALRAGEDDNLVLPRLDDHALDAAANLAVAVNAQV
jgi:hypothetical protein